MLLGLLAAVPTIFLDYPGRLFRLFNSALFARCNHVNHFPVPLRSSQKRKKKVLKFVIKIPCHCIANILLQYHRVPSEGELPSDPVSDESKDLGIIPCKPHSSRITSSSACNCGRVQDHREDPFDLKVCKRCKILLLY